MGCSTPAFCTAARSRKYDYTGINDCVAADILLYGPRTCDFGCIRLGTCVKSCRFSAITLNADRLPVVDEEKCTGCGQCAASCPKKVITMLPIGYHVAVECSSKAKGTETRKVCSVACLGCGLCAKNCHYSAIKIVDNLVTVDSEICIAKCTDAVCARRSARPVP